MRTLQTQMRLRRVLRVQAQYQQRLHQEGNSAQLASAASGSISLGRLTGLVSADLLLVQVMLMARVPDVVGDNIGGASRVAGLPLFSKQLVQLVECKTIEPLIKGVTWRRDVLG